ncbi:MAG: hypothetical protein UW07_C0001G0014 [Candidatus Nomurabacteria bacterium GW2011_GWF2_43_8]|uniref:Zinc-binding domain-containing protein n=3 Tax=Candidatus Nomuraibacteriota TaxID=1752729 RepID=A0A0G1HZY5_9BACT|nr:MAG: hypothetical protein UV76_C0013G0008 [Candidatus Nomurabacteria bacterium GW2011_GWA2_43_15]KKT19170.1 MAG: hypothetical protein UW02_C0014G0011 [Candidatus Nomurabacteria bacterium GW2011_GWB1_43_7]KKT25182.1 MAG: hypothetical protein UW07_C0001G0014 [Candidatus Nomurabacteria bacterium GW2011_GWF2_43_8]
MQQETKVCQNCKKEFVIEPDDFGFYEKIGVLPPKMCPECRMQLRLCFKNERRFYKRICDNCKKDIIAIYSANKPYPVWCSECWWSSDLDPQKYAVDYNPNKSFYEQFNEVWIKAPKQALAGMRNVNCFYLNNTADNKNCYLIIESSNNENCIHCYWIQLSKDLVDCSFTNKVELSYEVDDCYDCNSLKFSKGCHSCLDSSFLLDCRNCQNCLGCINLRGQKYIIFNKQYSKEEYENKLKSFKLDTHSGVESFKKQFQDFIKDKPRKFAEITNAVNSTGNYMTNVKNNRYCFHSYEAEDNAYSIHVWRGAKDCMDCNTAGRAAELIYNSLNTGIEASNVTCSQYCWSSQFMEYCLNCPDSNHSFGCASLVKGSYFILNKQYTKEDYKKLRAEIIAKMKKEGIYGDFFPKELSPFGYNESLVMDEFPLTKEEALAEGFKWEDTPRGTYGKETVDWKKFPDSILDLSSDFDVGKEVFICMECKKNYRIIEDELSFYRRMQIPIPRNCPECRHDKRVKNRGPNKLWHRKCMREGCQNEFETPYAAEKPEIIYCDECYKRLVY